MRRVIGYIWLACVALLSLWFCRAPVSDAQLHANSPVLMDREGLWLNVRTVEAGTWRVQADLSEIDSGYLEALLEIEDRRFYRHAGVDGSAILRALQSWRAAGKPVSGASTITMQLVRQYKPRPRTLRAKAIESLEALRFELHYSKAEILTQYLTRISYGGNIEGIEAASRIYLGKPPKYLSPDEIALLIALPQAPEARRPDRNAQGAKRGRNRILQRLHQGGLLNERDLDDGKTAAIPLESASLPNTAWLTAKRLAGDGQKVESTLEAKHQAALERLLDRYVSNLDTPVNASALVIHAPTREVRAHAAVGRRDHDGGWLDMTRAVRSPGSTLKPFVYGLGMDDGIISADTRLRDAPSRFGAYRPENFDRRYYGDVTLSEALQHSLNIPAVAVLDQVGGRRLEASLRAAGVGLSQSQPGEDGAEAGLALALGGTGLRAVDLGVLYAALANEGEAAPLRWKLSESERETSFALMQADTAQALRKIMADAPRPVGVVPGHLGQEMPIVAYKTGTSYGFRDSWAAGLSGDYVIIVWVGRPDGGPRPGVTGRLAAAPLLFDIANILPVSRRSIQRVDQPEPMRLAASDAQAPQIIFPADKTDVAVTHFDARSLGVDLVVQSTKGLASLYVDGEVVPETRDGHVWYPDAPGFYRLTAVDKAGQSSPSVFRVLQTEGLRHPGL